MTAPEFPRFKPVELEDRQALGDFLWKAQPQTSEWTFTNLFIWRSHYRFQWCRLRDWLLVLAEDSRGPYFFQPLGPPPRAEAVRQCLRWLREERGVASPRIERADRRLAEELKGARDLAAEPTRDQFDYLYRAGDLISLAGRKYHGKRNHINRFLQTRSFTYAPLEERHLDECLKLGGLWCRIRRCEEDLNLTGEWAAVREALSHFPDLKFQGGVILLQDQVQAFSLGERLNEETAVVHVEKANPEIPGLYPLVNQQFCEKAWAGLSWVNREQDLGEPGLRKAKESYFPDRLVEKFRIRPAEDP